jgi:hypothetical protein
VLDVLFRLTIAGAAVTGCGLYFKTPARWVRQCHLLMGVLAVIFCGITYFLKG